MYLLNFLDLQNWIPRWNEQHFMSTFCMYLLNFLDLQNWIPRWNEQHFMSTFCVRLLHFLDLQNWIPRWNEQHFRGTFCVVLNVKYLVILVSKFGFWTKSWKEALDILASRLDLDQNPRKIHWIFWLLQIMGVSESLKISKPWFRMTPIENVVNHAPNLHRPSSIYLFTVEKNSSGRYFFSMSYLSLKKS